MVRVYDLEPIIVPSEYVEAYKFRIEVLREVKGRKCFYPRVWRQETYRIQPRFVPPHAEGETSDEEILVLDTFVLDTLKKWEQVRGKTAEDVLKKVSARIEEIFLFKSPSTEKKKRR